MNYRTRNAIVWLLVGGLVGALAVFRITSLDFWWHLRTGQYILAARTIPTHDIYSYTALGRPWVSHEWFFEVLLALVYRLGGLTGAILLKAGIVLLGVAFTFLTLRRLKIAPVIGVPLVILGAFLVTSRAYCRPHIVTESLLALYLLVLLSWKYVPEVRNNRKLVWWLLPVQLVWANSHAGGVLGVALFVGFIACEFIQNRLSRAASWIAADALPDRELGFLLEVAAGLLLVSFLNPNFHRALLYPVAITGETTFLNGIQELASPLSAAFWRTDFLRAFLVLAGIGLISFVVSLKRLELSHLILFIAALAAAGSAVRNLPILGVIAVPLIAVNLQSLIRRQTDAPWVRFAGSGTASAILGLIPAALLVLVFARGVQVPGDYRRPGFGYDPRLFPVRAADFMARHEVQGNVFSTLQYNDYFIWRWFPNRRVFIDGRLDVFGPELFKLYERLLLSDPATDSVFHRYNINCCIVPLPPADSRIAQRHLSTTLGQRSDWSLVYWDDLALIYVRNIPAHERLIAENAYHAVVPELLGLPAAGTEPESLLAETQRAVQANPESPLALTMLGQAYSQRNMLAEARDAFQQALSRNPTYTYALAALAGVELRARDYPAASATYQRILALEPRSVTALYGLGVSYLRADRPAQAEKTFLEALAVNPLMVSPYILLGDIYRQQGRTDDAIRMWQEALTIDPQNAAAQERLRTNQR